mmetsp:Transcript_29668/g.43788  ORF Transcript_29668/g.43788 Transcript_29668/m.43788 type:complete len:564 (+) Transcript_29668:176-1867(+)
MGQCSNLPAESRSTSAAPSSNNGSMHVPSGSSRKRFTNPDGRSSGQHRGNGRQQRDDNVEAMDTNNDLRTSSDNSTTPLTSKKGMRGQKTHNMDSMVNVVRHGVNKFDPFLNNDPNSQQNGNVNVSNHSKPPHPTQSANYQADRRNPNNSMNVPSPEMIENEENIPQPPESAVRTRCYRLNLESSPLSPHGGDYHNISSNTPSNLSTGPMEYAPPPHHLSRQPSSTRWNSGIPMCHSDESSVQSATTVAVTTAKIFRGITVDKNGTILSQNARATRSSRNKNGGPAGQKQGEKSRQAAKIDKAKDLVDEAIEGVKDGEEPSNMVSLVIMGEYDEMKQLVRDGSKKLREAENLPDEALLAINRPRGGISGSRSESNLNCPPISPNRKRVSPHLMPTGQPYNPAKNSRHKVPPSSASVSSNTPPKLKGHPRDRPSTRRLGGNGGDSIDDNDNSGRSGSRRFSHVKDHCNDLPMFGGGQSDWSEALGLSGISIWNCGATGGTTHSLSPNNKAAGGVGNGGSGRYRESVQPQGMGYEGRNETNNYDRMRGGNEMRVGGTTGGDTIFV